jgi:tetratricopeptide (TPR) repeat protein
MAKRSKKTRKLESVGPSSPRFSRDWIWGTLLVLAVIVAYQPLWWAGYIWDDVTVITGNPVIVGPLGLKEIWTTRAADICPLTLTTFWVEYRLWGLDPRPYHLVNIFQHAASAVLLWIVLRRLRIPGAWLGATLWALHPVQAESVAWITEMKNTQSCIFYLLTILFFVKTVTSSNRDKWNYQLTLIFAAMAMASKSSTVVLPMVLCLCAWWMEGRWHWRNLARISPIFFMSILAGSVSMWTQQAKIGMFGDLMAVRSWPERLATVGDGVWFYLGKLIWPHPLVTFYPRWEVVDTRVLSYLPTLAVILVLFTLWAYRNSWARPWFFAFAYFLVALFPILGFFENTIFRYAQVFDHLQYLASMGPLALAGVALWRLRDFVTAEKSWLTLTLAAGTILLLGITTWRQSWIYLNEETLWNHNLAWYPKSDAAGYNLGVVLAEEKRNEEAIIRFRTALENSPNNVFIRNRLGKSLAETGRVDEGIEQLIVALKSNPHISTIHNNLGKAYLQKGQVDNALVEFKKSIAIDADNAEGHYSLGVGLAKKGEVDEAIAEFRWALDINPNDTMAHNNLGVELLNKGQLDEAMAEFEETLQLNPEDRSAKDNLVKAQAIRRQGSSPK